MEHADFEALAKRHQALLVRLSALSQVYPEMITTPLIDLPSWALKCFGTRLPSPPGAAN